MTDSSQPSTQTDAAIAVKLKTWYTENPRVLPWRITPGSDEWPDPYEIWLAEIMAQQTTIKAVERYHKVFMQRWPTLADLAHASDDEILSQWAGLGYYSRARNLIACARILMQDYKGQLPKTEAELLKLPGIGPYSAAAIAAVAFGEPATVVDGNVERLFTRLYAISEPLPRARKLIRSHVAKVLEYALHPERRTNAMRSGDFAQACMDFGGMVCKPRNPNCKICPLAPHCKGKFAPETFPVKPPKKPRPERVAIMFVMTTSSGKALLERRPPKGLLGGMPGFPSTKWEESWPNLNLMPNLSDTAAPQALPLERWPSGLNWQDLNWRELEGTISHIFTHFHLTCRIWTATLSDTQAAMLEHQKGLFFRNLKALCDTGEEDLSQSKSIRLPSLMSKVARHALP